MNLHTHLTKCDNHEPTTLTQTLKDHKWRRAMSEKFDALVKNGTWALVPSDSSQNLAGCKWIFRTKHKFDGSIDGFKARLVAKGFHQRPGIDYQDTFNPVVKPTTVRIVLSIAVSHGWSLWKLGVNNTFLQGHLSENVYMSHPLGFVDKDNPSYVYKLNKAIFGLKQAPHAWYHELKTFLLQFGFQNSYADTSLFVFHADGHTMYLLVYVDDLILIGENATKVNQFIAIVAQGFSIKDLGLLIYFLSVEVVPNKQGLLLSQRRYIMDLLTQTKM